MLGYIKLSRDKSTFRSFTGLSVEEFDSLYDKVESRYNKIKRKELSRSEISGALKRLYEEWREEKKYIKNMNQGIVSHGETLKGNIKKISTKYIKNIEEYHPRDPRNPLTISKFIQENDVPMKKMEVTRLIAIDDLPLDVKKGFDEGYIDISSKNFVKYSHFLY